MNDGNGDVDRVCIDHYVGRDVPYRVTKDGDDDRGVWFSDARDAVDYMRFLLGMKKDDPRGEADE